MSRLGTEDPGHTQQTVEYLGRIGTQKIMLMVASSTRRGSVTRIKQRPRLVLESVCAMSCILPSALNRTCRRIESLKYFGAVAQPKGGGGI